MPPGAFTVLVLELTVWLVSAVTMVMTLSTLMIRMETITEVSEQVEGYNAIFCKVWHLSTQRHLLKLASTHFF